MSLRMMRMSASYSFLVGLIAIAVSLDSFAAADFSGSEVFSHLGRVSKSHMAKVYFPKNVAVELKTNTPAGQATDPVLFVLSTTVDSSGRPTKRLASDDMNSGDEDAKITYTSTTGEWMNVIVVAYDTNYHGETDLLIKIGSAAPQTVTIWAGGTAYKTGWTAGDTFTLTGHYREYTLESMCVNKIGSRPGNLSTTWDDYNMTCNSRYTTAAGWIINAAYTKNQICAEAAAYHINAAGESIPTMYNWINPANPTCQYVSDATDSYALAVSNWAKIDRVCTTTTNNQGLPITTCFDTALPPSVRAMDDDSGTGRHFRLTMSETVSPMTGATPPMLISALSPWVTQYKAYYDNPNVPQVDEQVYAALADDECSLRWRDYFSQWRRAGTYGVMPIGCPGGAEAYLLADNAFQPYMRMYHDKTVVNGANDADEDGLSAQLEAVLGTSPTKRDHDYDGIVDGLEVYGPLVPTRLPSQAAPLDPGETGYGTTLGSYLPLPLYGTDPKVKDVFFEWDTQQHVVTLPAGQNTAVERLRSLEAAGETFALSNIHLINILGGPNRNTEIADSTPIYQYRRDRGTGGGYVATTTIAQQLLTAQQQTNQANWALSGVQLMKDVAPQYFDLAEYPFVRYGAFAATTSADRRLCGVAMSTVIGSQKSGDGDLSHRLPYGRYVVLTARKTSFADAAGETRSCMDTVWNDERRVGGATTHEIGHLMGLGHGGAGWVYEYQFAPNHWSQMSYGYSLPLMEVQVRNGANWVTRNLPANIDWDGDGQPGGDFPMRNQQSGGGRKPAHFSKSAAMVDIDEGSLNEQAGLLGNGSRYVFERIRDFWTNPGVAGAWVPEVGVTHVDWDRDAIKAAVGATTTNANLVSANVSVTDVPQQDFDGDNDQDFVDRAGNCWHRNDQGWNNPINPWINLSTGILYANSNNGRNAACRDTIPGTYTVAKTKGMAISEVKMLLEAHDPNATTYSGTKMTYATYQNETDYLKDVDMSGWTQNWDGIWQYRVVGGNPLIQYASSPGNAVANLPTEELE